MVIFFSSSRSCWTGGTSLINLQLSEKHLKTIWKQSQMVYNLKRVQKQSQNYQHVWLLNYKLQMLFGWLKSNTDSIQVDRFEIENSRCCWDGLKPNLWNVHLDSLWMRITRCFLDVNSYIFYENLKVTIFHKIVDAFQMVFNHHK